MHSPLALGSGPLLLLLALLLPSARAFHFTRIGRQQQAAQQQAQQAAAQRLAAVGAGSEEQQQEQQPTDRGLQLAERVPRRGRSIKGVQYVRVLLLLGCVCGGWILGLTHLHVCIYTFIIKVPDLPLGRRRGVRLPPGGNPATARREEKRRRRRGGAVGGDRGLAAERPGLGLVCEQGALWFWVGVGWTGTRGLTVLYHTIRHIQPWVDARQKEGVAGGAEELDALAAAAVARWA